MWRIFVLLLCLIVSSAAVYYSAKYCYQATDATRGGAIASILALAILTYDTRTPERKFSQFVSLVIETDQSLSDAAERPLERRVSDSAKHIKLLKDGVEEYIKATRKETKEQTWALWAATFISVAFWGFGDLMMLWLRHYNNWTCS